MALSPGALPRFLPFSIHYLISGIDDAYGLRYMRGVGGSPIHEAFLEQKAFQSELWYRNCRQKRRKGKIEPTPDVGWPGTPPEFQQPVGIDANGAMMMPFLVSHVVPYLSFSLKNRRL